MIKKKHSRNRLSFMLSIVAFVCLLGFFFPSQAKAAGSWSQPTLKNGGFERNSNSQDLQLYKAQRVNRMQGKVYQGNYALKIGKASPGKESEGYPRWLYNEGKGSANLVIRNVKPNTKYKVSMNYFNETGVKFRLGVLDIEGSKNWKPGQINSNYQTFDQKTTQWQSSSFEIVTGPRTTEIYAFALTEWTGNENGSGVFYIDNVNVAQEGQVTTDNKQTIAYQPKSSEKFPTIVPAIKQFTPAGKSKFQVNKLLQRIYVPRNLYSQGRLLGEKLKKAGVVKNYVVSTNMRFANNGIVLNNRNVSFNAGLNETEKKEAYELNISRRILNLTASTGTGIQNGIMTIVQALKQRDALPTGTVHDYSDQEYRGLQVDSGRRYYSMNWLKKTVDEMAELKLNKMQLRLKDNEGIRYQSQVAPQFSDTNGRAWSRSEIKSLVAYAKQRNIEVIPEIDFPGHSEQDGVYFDKSWLLSDKSNALDISNPDVRKYMASIYKEAFELFDSNIVHIGGDEYFQTSGFSDPDNKLAKWAQEETGNSKATKEDAFKLFINEMAQPYLAQGKKVFVWNDNVFNLNSVVKLDSRLIVDVWAGTIYNSITAGIAADNGYQVVGSASDLYHDLWPDNDKIDRPLPEFLYNQWQSNSYSKGFNPHENLTAQQAQQSKGQFFPIWDDANGYAPEYVLDKTLYPRLALFANNMWGSQAWNSQQNKPSYSEMELLVHYIGPDFTKSIEYTNTDVQYIAKTINEKMYSVRGSNLKVRLKKVNLSNYLRRVFHNQVRTDNNGKIYKMIHDFENLEN